MKRRIKSKTCNQISGDQLVFRKFTLYVGQPIKRSDEVYLPLHVIRIVSVSPAISCVAVSYPVFSAVTVWGSEHIDTSYTPVEGVVVTIRTPSDVNCTPSNNMPHSEVTVAVIDSAVHIVSEMKMNDFNASDIFSFYPPLSIKVVFIT